MENGYIKLYRKITEWEWYKHIPTKVLFFHLLIESNHAPHRWRGIQIDTGQTVTSIEHLSNETGLTVRQVRTALEHLKKTGEIDIQTTNKFSLITVENYTFYQGKEKSSDKQTTINRQASDKQATTNKNDKNDKNNKLIKSNTNAFAKPTVKEVSDYIDEKGYSVDPEQFIAFYESNGWKVGRNPMKSWKSAVVTWEKRNNDTGKNRRIKDETVEAYDRVIFGE